MFIKTGNGQNVYEKVEKLNIRPALLKATQ